jgi:Flp pilus assembly protein TadB
MELAFLGVLAVCIACSAVATFLTNWRLHRRIRILEYHVADYDESLLSEKQKAKAQKRWAKTKDEKAELEQWAAKMPPRELVQPISRFANDPVE